MIARDAIAIALTSLAAAYCGYAFVKMDLNPAHWGEFARVLGLSFALVIGWSIFLLRRLMKGDL